ncbi:MAG: hypothetical protein JWL71_555 [Acidobacteria bacterium]|nr:hypothetical protein [Acidobacteriota bacterium]
MRRFVFAALFVTCAATAAVAQPDAMLSPLATAIACAPPPTFEPASSDAPHIIGGQDAIPRTLFGDRDRLVIGGGTASGLQPGQQFFVRRAITYGSSRASRGSRTLGWLRIVAVNETTAIAAVSQVCGPILVGDHLEPFVEPVVSADIEKDDTPGQPDFTNLAHIVAGNEDRTAVGAGELALIDWGQAQGLMPGARFAIFRDAGGKGVPLTSVGEGVVVSTSKAMALTRITRVRDAIYSGDYVAMRK